MNNLHNFVEFKEQLAFHDHHDPIATKAAHNKDVSAHGYREKSHCLALLHISLFKCVEGLVE